MRGLIATLCAALLAAGPSAGLAHDRWGNGEPVPPWVKATCCGPSDVHRIPASDIQARPDGYHIEGLTTVVPYDRALPSPDGAYWGFWSEEREPDVLIYCFFAPVNGS